MIFLKIFCPKSITQPLVLYKWRASRANTRGCVKIETIRPLRPIKGHFRAKPLTENGPFFLSDYQLADIQILSLVFSIFLQAKNAYTFIDVLYCSIY